MQTIEKAIDWATSQSYVAHEGALTEEQLVHVLNKGHPVPYAVLWVDKDTGMYMGGHIMILGGCTGDGRYYLHDSLSNLTRTKTWQALTHAELMAELKWIPDHPAVPGHGPEAPLAEHLGRAELCCGQSWSGEHQPHHPDTSPEAAPKFQ